MNKLLEITTLGQLKKTDYKSRSVKDELRANLIAQLKKKEGGFEGIIGFEDTVIPDLQTAILSRHNILLLGLRGQAKTRIARLLVNLLDEYIPYIEGAELFDDPLAPISWFGHNEVLAKGDATPIAWLHRSERYTEKLATPDVTVADLIGDVDPIKAATMKLTYSDERVIHFGLIPRAHRGIFVINELPDLQARIQVSLFNILQEGDIQIRGFKLRFPLDVQFVFTANPEDYTNRGSIVTPLKDRIGSQILTHYPTSVAIAKSITAQEVKVSAERQQPIIVPEAAKELIEQIGFEARRSEFVDTKSGISARMSISAYENMVSAAELRLLKTKGKKTAVRLSDFAGVVPAITGKVEVVYEGEQEGARFVADHLIQEGVKALFELRFPKLPKLEKQGTRGAYHDLMEWFAQANDALELTEVMDDATYRNQLLKVKPLAALVDQFCPAAEEDERFFLMEVVLWALAGQEKLSKSDIAFGHGFGDKSQDLLNAFRN